MANEHDVYSQPNSSSTVMLVVGVALIFLAVFVDQEVWERIVHTFDVRSWRVFTWTTFGASLAFACYWSCVWLRDMNEPLDEDANICAKRLLLATSVLLIEAWGWVFLSDTEFPRYIGVQLRQFLYFGRYSSTALGIFLGIALLVLGNIFIIARWLKAALDRSVN